MFDGVQLSSTVVGADTILAIAERVAPNDAPQAGRDALLSHAAQV
jgi:hypothetical protein